MACKFLAGFGIWNVRNKSNLKKKRKKKDFFASNGDIIERQTQ